MTQKVFDKIKKYLPYYKRIHIVLYSGKGVLLNINKIIDFGSNYITLEHGFMDSFFIKTIHRKDIRFICIYTDFFIKIKTRSKLIN